MLELGSCYGIVKSPNLSGKTVKIFYDWQSYSVVSPKVGSVLFCDNRRKIAAYNMVMDTNLYSINIWPNFIM